MILWRPGKTGRYVSGLLPNTEPPQTEPPGNSERFDRGVWLMLYPTSYVNSRFGVYLAFSGVRINRNPTGY